MTAGPPTLRVRRTTRASTDAGKAVEHGGESSEATRGFGVGRTSWRHRTVATGRATRAVSAGTARHLLADNATTRSGRRRRVHLRRETLPSSVVWPTLMMVVRRLLLVVVPTVIHGLLFYYHLSSLLLLRLVLLAAAIRFLLARLFLYHRLILVARLFGMMATGQRGSLLVGGYSMMMMMMVIVMMMVGRCLLVVSPLVLRALLTLQSETLRYGRPERCVDVLIDGSLAIWPRHGKRYLAHGTTWWLVVR